MKIVQFQYTKDGLIVLTDDGKMFIKPDDEWFEMDLPDLRAEDGQT